MKTDARRTTQHPYGPRKTLILTWFCGVFTNHRAVNWSDGKRHGCYCLRCKRDFGNAWGASAGAAVKTDARRKPNKK